MYTLLMLDDDLLFRRDNVVRRYGEAELRPDAVYTDPAMATPWPACWVFRLDSGCYRMLYLGAPRNELRQHYLLGAVSTDGVHFEPEDYTGEIDLEHRIAVNMIRAVGDEEIGAVFEDACTPSLSERYRMLTTGVVISAENDPETYYVRTTIYVSGDLLHWTRKAEIPPFRAEPLMSVFHNRAHSCMTIAHRPWWGIRKVGIRDTADWVNYSSYEPVMQADALDAPLAEVYGMTVFPYNGIYLGFPHIYSGAAPGLHAKFFGGTMRVQLAYSSDGHHWFRSLRTPLLSGSEGKKYGLPEWKMVWATGMQELPDPESVHLCRRHGTGTRPRVSAAGYPNQSADLPSAQRRFHPSVNRRLECGFHRRDAGMHLARRRVPLEPPGRPRNGGGVRIRGCEVCRYEYSGILQTGRRFFA